MLSGFFLAFVHLSPWWGPPTPASCIPESRFPWHRNAKLFAGAKAATVDEELLTRQNFPQKQISGPSAAVRQQGGSRDKISDQELALGVSLSPISSTLKVKLLLPPSHPSHLALSGQAENSQPLSCLFGSCSLSLPGQHWERSRTASSKGVIPLIPFYLLLAGLKLLLCPGCWKTHRCRVAEHSTKSSHMWKVSCGFLQ